MHEVQVQLSDHLYAQALRRAVEAGFKSVEDYAADVLKNDLDEGEKFDHLFTAERMSHIDSVLAEVDAGGKTYTDGDVRTHFRNRIGA